MSAHPEDAVKHARAVLLRLSPKEQDALSCAMLENNDPWGTCERPHSKQIELLKELLLQASAYVDYCRPEPPPDGHHCGSSHGYCAGECVDFANWCKLRREMKSALDGEYER